MDKNEIKKKLEQDYKVAYVAKLIHDEKEYVKAIQNIKNGIKYVYYEIEKNELKEVEDKEIVKYLDKVYGIKVRDIIC